MKSALPRVDLTTRPAGAQEVGAQLAQTLPPPTNRGVTCTTAPDAGALVDWFSYTVPDELPIEDAIPGGRELEWTALDHGGLGYRCAAMANGIRVFYDGQDGMGKHVSLSGSACRELEAVAGDELAAWGGWGGYLGRVEANGWKITRLDVAFDDRAGILDVPTMREAADAGHYTSTWHRYEATRSRRRRGDSFGETLYFGAASSDSFLRVYDKAAERRAKLGAGAGQDAGEDGPHIRVEWQTRGDTARALAQLLAGGEDGLEAVLACLHRKLDFKTPNPSDSNKRRWDTAPWWAEFLRHVGKRRLDVAPAVRTLDTVSAWLHRQCAPSLALILEAANGDPRVIRLLIDEGRDRLRPRHRALLTTRAA